MDFSDSKEEKLQALVDEYITHKQTTLMQMKKGLLGKEEFLEEARASVASRYQLTPRQTEEVVEAF